MDFEGRSKRLIASGSQRVKQPDVALPHLELSTQVVGVLGPTAFTKRYHPRIYLKGVGRRLVYHQLVYQKRQVSQKIVLSLPKIGKSLRRLHPKGTAESVLFYWRLKSENSLSHVTLNWFEEKNMKRIWIAGDRRVWPLGKSCRLITAAETRKLMIT